MAAPALLSVLGFPGWGPLHLWLARDGEPGALAGRLRRAGEAAATPAASPLLLPALLRDGHDLEPLAAPRPRHLRVPAGRTYRHLLICRHGAASPLRLSSWSWSPSLQRWRRCCEPLPAQLYIDRFAPPRPP